VENNIGLVAGALLLGFAIAAGVIFRLLGGRGKSVSSSEQIDLQKLKAVKNALPVTQFGKKATLLQFSTEYCGICPGVSRALHQLEYRNGGLLHLEVDITERLDLAAHFAITQTPTIFILDKHGALKFRVAGAPKPGIIQQELEKLGAL
jgi:thiol-disulfide isomerase/thioredoxin